MGKLHRHCRSAIDPRVFKHREIVQNHPLLQLYGETDGTVLTSHSPKRTVARPYTYAVVRELEVRESRIQELFGHDVSNLERCGIDDEMTAESRHQLDSLQRACRVADLVGDTVARIVARAGWVDGYNAHLADAHYYVAGKCRCNAWVSTVADSLIFDGLAGKHGHVLDSMPLQPGEQDKGIAMAKLAQTIRELQIALIQRLSQWDLIYLSLLTRIAGAEYSRSVPEGMSLSDPQHLDKVTAFQECALRRGASFSLWSIRSPRLELPLAWHDDRAVEWFAAKKLGDDAVRDVVWELHLWEQGAADVRINKDFWTVEDPALAALMQAFDSEIKAGRMGRDGSDDGSDEDTTMPAMQAGLQMTTVRSLSKKAELKGLSEYERWQVKAVRPWDPPSDATAAA